MTDPHPEGLGVSTCIELALKDSGVERDEVRVAEFPAALVLSAIPRMTAPAARWLCPVPARSI